METDCVLHVAHPATAIISEQEEIGSHSNMVFKTRFNIILALSLGNISDQLYLVFSTKICTLYFIDYTAATIINPTIGVHDSSRGSFDRKLYCASLQSTLA
jgi:hypothetical protein